MKKLIIINGTMGVGKTTISKLLCERLNKSAFLDGDWCFDLHPFIATTETLTMAINHERQNDKISFSNWSEEDGWRC